MVLLDDEHALDALQRRGERARGCAGASSRSAISRASTPCAAARASASRTAAVVEPNVITAASPSPSTSAQRRP